MLRVLNPIFKLTISTAIVVSINELRFKRSNTFLLHDRMACIQQLFMKKNLLKFCNVALALFIVNIAALTCKEIFQQKMKTTNGGNCFTLSSPFFSRLLKSIALKNYKVITNMLRKWNWNESKIEFIKF